MRRPRFSFETPRLYDSEPMRLEAYETLRLCDSETLRRGAAPPQTRPCARAYVLTETRLLTFSFR